MDLEVFSLMKNKYAVYGDERLNFKTLEGTFNATFLRDSNSRGGLINGGSLKGEYIIIKLQVNAENAGILVALNSVTVKFIESFQNSR